MFIDPARRAREADAGRGERPVPVLCVALAGWDGSAASRRARPAPRCGPAGWELEFIAVARDLKEAVGWSPAMATAGPAGDDPARRPHAGARAGPARAGAGAGEFLCDPSPAVTRAGLVEELARELGAWKIDERIAFLSSGTALRTPFGRGLRVIDSGPWNQKQLPAELRELDIGAVNIRRRGLAGDVDRLLRGLRLTGSRRATVVMTRAGNRPWGLIVSTMNDRHHRGVTAHLCYHTYRSWGQ